VWTLVRSMNRRAGDLGEPSVDFSEGEPTKNQ
jgi:hypothetical protein